ncbi:MAG: hypothetical protein ACRDY7_18535 [Acidimicrobiia bacterium]
MIRRSTVVVGLASILMLAGVRPAVAHEEVFPTTVVVGRPSFLTLSAANERSVNLVAISLTAPPGAAFGEATRDPGGWKVTVDEHTVSWSGGSVAPGRFAQWGVELEGPDQPGSLSFTATLQFADGRSDEAEIPIMVTAETAIAQAPVATTMATPPTTTASASPASSGRSESSSGTANAALAVGILAALLAVAAFVSGRRNRGPSTNSAVSGQEQDW